MATDARERIRQYGEFNYFTSYMSQPKFQLDTFRSWAGISSDISYYLNSHHVEYVFTGISADASQSIHCWAMEGNARPV